MLRPATSAFALALLTGAAAAADLPPPIGIAPPSMLSAKPVAFDWSGFYFGGHGGWGFGSGEFSDGATAGGQVGVNWQYGRFVVGFEGEGSWVDNWGTANNGSRLVAVQTALGRGGFAFDRLLAYGTAGVAVENLEALFGWAAGAGVEYAVTDHWIVGAEYVHYDFADNDSDVLRGRASYLFGSRSSDFTHGGIFDEVRLGVLGFWQDNASGEEGAYATAQILFDPFVDPFNNWMLDVLLRPRPHIGGTASPAGTDQLFAGLTWTLPIGRTFFAEASFGGTVHNGPIKGAPVSLGCHELFRGSVGAGANIGERWRIVASVDHSSHFGLCSPIDDGLTHVGASLGYRF